MLPQQLAEIISFYILFQATEMYFYVFIYCFSFSFDLQ